MSGDNGDINLKKEMEKSAEVLLKEKKEAFEKDPDQFIEMKDIVACMMRVPGGLAHYIGPGRRKEYVITKGELDHQLNNVLTAIDEAVAKKSKSSIINPFAKKGGGFGKKRF